MANEVTICRALGRNEFDSLLLKSVLQKLGYKAVGKKIHDLIKAGVIISVKNGFYTLSEMYARGPIVTETLANLLYGPSCLSLEFALSYYGLIPERVHRFTSVTPKRYKEFKTPYGVFTYEYLPMAKYSEGVTLITLDETHNVLMASKEKALFDYVYLRKISISTLQAAEDFLADDLRIDSTYWQRFDLLQLYKLQRVYKNSSMSIIISFIESRRL